jgi:surface antigen/Flp pilus assembly pilin Flp
MPSHLRGQGLFEYTLAFALIAVMGVVALTLFGSRLTSAYSGVGNALTSTVSTSPVATPSPAYSIPSTLPATFPTTGPSATFLNPALQVQMNGSFISGNQCNPDCPMGAKFIGIPQFVAKDSYDTYADGIFSIVDKNQCTYGAIAEWLTLHQSQVAWHPSRLLQYPSIQDNAGSMYADASNAGYTLSSTPVSGSLVVYQDGWAGSPNGHIATVVGVSADGTHYTVIEQNILYVELNDESGSGFPPYRWNLGGFDIRTAQFPDPEIAGLIYGPPSTTLTASS